MELQGKCFRILFACILYAGIVLTLSLQATAEDRNVLEIEKDIVKLPAPAYDGSTSIEKTLLKRRSVREYTNKPASLSEVSQVLWAAQGITDQRGFRTAPSGGGLYPLELYIVAGNVDDLPDGIYKYNPFKHELLRISKGDMRNHLCHAAHDQASIKNAAFVVIFSAVYERTTGKYGERGVRYVHMEAGHVSQNIYLQSVSLNLGTLVIGAFNDNEVKKVLKMPDREYPLCIMPVGKR